MNTTSKSRKAQTRRKKKYNPPVLTKFGKVVECTQMPGGSLGAEGGSGKGRS